LFARFPESGFLHVAMSICETNHEPQIAQISQMSFEAENHGVWKSFQHKKEQCPQKHKQSV
jgi:hypothetical protein